MGWKLTSQKKRSRIIRVLDQLSAQPTHLTPLQQKSLEHLPSRQADAVYRHSNRMISARERTPKGVFQRIQRDKAIQEGHLPRGAGKGNAVPNRLLQKLDREGIHRDIMNGIQSSSGFESYIEAVRAKSRGSSRGGLLSQGAAGFHLDPDRVPQLGGAGSSVFSSANLPSVYNQRSGVSTPGGLAAATTEAREALTPAAVSTPTSPPCPTVDPRLSPTTIREIQENVEAPQVGGIPPSEDGEYTSLALSQLGPANDWSYEKYERPIDPQKWKDFKGLKEEIAQEQAQEQAIAQARERALEQEGDLEDDEKRKGGSKSNTSKKVGGKPKARPGQ